MRHWKGWLAVVLIVLLGAAGVLLWRNRGSTAETTTFTEVLTVERGNLTASVSPTGEVYAPHQAQLSFDVTGIPLIELNVAAGQTVNAGDVLARIDPASLERALEEAQAELVSAQETLEAAQAPSTALEKQKAELGVTQAETALEQARENLVDLETPDLAAAERAVRRAASEVESARLNLTLAQVSTTVGKNVRDLEYALDWHTRKLRDLEAQYLQGHVDEDALAEEREALAEARADLEDGQAKASAALESAQDTLSAAEDALADAQASLADLQAGPTALELAQARDQVAQAEYNLAKAEADLAQLEAGPDPKVVQLAQARYDAAQADVEDAQATLDAATMVAPFDGTVVSVGAEVGDLVSSGTVIVSLADLTELRVRASVDETDISQVEVAQPVQITFDAFPGRQFQGQVLEVPLEGELSQNIVIYQVPISLEGTEGVALKSGMTANLQIVVGQRENALLVPLLAVQQGDTGEVVLVQDAPGEAVVQAPVELGLNDGTYVEVLRGLNEGDQVVVQYETSDETTGFGLGRGGGGGFLGTGIRLLP
jgi:HlyD family secretion protein